MLTFLARPHPPSTTNGRRITPGTVPTVQCLSLRFADRDSRIYFENTVRGATGLKATQSFPKQIRAEMRNFMARVQADNPGKIVMIRPDARTLRLNAFVKIEGEKSWTRYHESSPIPLGIMISTVGATDSAAGSQPATADGPSKEDMQTDPPPHP